MQSPKPYREERPWGEFVEYSKNTSSTVKIITVKAGEALSLQHHHHRDEFWHVLSGNGSVQIDANRIPAKAGDDFFVPRETDHRIEAGSETLAILEIAFGEFDEGDIVRVEDKYGRV